MAIDAPFNQSASPAILIGSDLAGAELSPIASDLGGNLHVTKTIKLVGDTAEGNVFDTNLWSPTMTGTATATIANNLMRFQTGTTANSSVIATSSKKARYIVGTFNAFKGSIRLDAGATNNVRRWGIFDSQNGMFFQLSGTTMGIGIRKTGVDTIITSFSTTNALILDTSFHTYEIRYGQGVAQFFQDGILVHTQSNPTASLTDTAHYKIGLENTNSSGGTANVSMYTRGVGVLRYGEIDLSPRYFHSNFFGRVQSIAGIAGANVNTFSVTLPAGSTSGNLLVAAVSVQGAAINSVTDNKRQTWTLATSISNASNGFLYIYYVPDSLPGVTTITATLNVLTNSNIGLVVAEYSGPTLVAPLDKVSTQAQNSATWSAGSVTTSFPIELLFTAVYNKTNANDTQTPGTGYTSVGIAGGATNQIYAEDQIVTAVGTYSGNGTNSASRNLYAAMATFQMVPNQNTLIANAPTVLKYGPATLRRIVVNAPGTGAAMVFIYDGVDTNGKLVAELSLANGIGSFDYELDLSDGLTLVTNSVTPDFTVIYD